MEYLPILIPALCFLLYLGWIVLDYRRWKLDQRAKWAQEQQIHYVNQEEIDRLKWAGDERRADEQPPFIGHKQQVYLGSTTDAWASEDGGKPKVFPG